MQSEGYAQSVVFDWGVCVCVCVCVCVRERERERGEQSVVGNIIYIY